MDIDGSVQMQSKSSTLTIVMFIIIFFLHHAIKQKS